MTKEDNKRRHDRFHTDNVHGKFSYSVRASVLNLSLGGLAVRTDTQLNIGRKYRFQLGNPTDAVGLTGSVRWCRMSGTEKLASGDIVPVYEAGISLDDVLTDKAEELLQFMEHNVTLDLKRRVAGRFKIEPSGPVVLSSDSEYLVKQISISGMMIESEVSLKPDTEFELEMRLGRHKFSTPARIIYISEVTLEDEGLIYRMGVEFVKTSPKMKEVLESFIRAEMKRAGKKPTKSKKKNG
jgi:hypothetical protein